MNLGNLLYLGLWAYEEPDGKHARKVLLNQNRAASLALFPELSSRLFVEPDSVSFFDQRLMPWREDGQDPEYFEHEKLTTFVVELLLQGSNLEERPAHITDDVLVVNVRRGDYFSVPQHQAEFGMDTAAYTLHAVQRAAEDCGEPGRLLVVSDDLDWCRAHLEDLSLVAPIEFREGGPADDLAALIHAPRLVIPNSTFSYWGGYIGDVLNPGRQVLAPWLFSRNLNSGRAHQLRKSWTVVEEVPGGWSVTS